MFSLGIGGLICVALVLVWVYFRLETSVRSEKEMLLKGTTEVAFSLMAEYDGRVKSGEFTIEEAQKRVASRIKALRYNGQEYFWINDLSPRMVMHPFKPELDGKDLSGLKDPNGKVLFVEMAKACKDKGEGFVDYMWPKPGESQPVSKLSFVKVFQPWGWIIGSGIYLDDIAKEMLALRNLFLGVAAFVALLGSLLCWWLARSTTRPINLAIAGLTSTAETVTSASAKMSSSSKQLAEGASQQAAAIEETTSSLEEISSMTARNAESANDADRLMRQTKDIIVRANGTMGQLTVSMDEISRASEETQKIIKTIDEIAFQTNLLALNAAVEAARAGEAGAGFAVVADEVRNLAMRAADAAKSTAALIEGTVKKIKIGSSLVQKNNGEFSEVSDMVTKTSGLVGEIAASSREQSQGIDHLTRAVHEMDRVVQQNAGSAEENAQVAQEISAKADPMKEMISDLESLVAGAKAGGGMQNRSAGRPHAKASKLSRAGGRPTALNAGGIVLSQQTVSMRHRKRANGKSMPAASGMQSDKIIPFEEDELRDF